MQTQMEKAITTLTEKLQSWLELFVSNIPNLVVAILVMTAAYFIAKYVNKWVYKLASKRFNQKSISGLIAKVSAVVVVLGALFLTLAILNLSQALTSVLTGAGITGLVIGLALQGTLANTFAGIVLSLREKIQVGNWVETNGYAGEVVDINLKDFTLKEADNNIVIIPNKTILESPLKNYSLTTKMRVVIECGVGYESDLELVEKITKETISKAFEQVSGTEEVEFYYTEFGASSINYMCRFWIDAESMLEKLKAKTKAIIEIKKAYDQEGINIPFPIRTLKVDKEIALSLPKEMEEMFSKN